MESILIKELAEEIIKQACMDYQDWTFAIGVYEAMPSLSKSQRKKYEAAKRGLPEVESFFLSDWFVDLSFGNLDGETLLAKLKKKVKPQGSVSIA